MTYGNPSDKTKNATINQLFKQIWSVSQIRTYTY